MAQRESNGYRTTNIDTKPTIPSWESTKGGPVKVSKVADVRAPNMGHKQGNSPSPAAK